jgi:hypothetical protein
MTTGRLDPEIERMAAHADQTVGDMCMGAMKAMVARNSEAHRVAVAHKGSVYFFDVICVGIKPPYEMRDVDEGSGEVAWFGQRAN